MKVLIYFEEKNIKHSGGPSGYLVPFLKFRDRFNSIDLSFITKEKVAARNNNAVIYEKKRNMLYRIIYYVFRKIKLNIMFETWSYMSDFFKIRNRTSIVDLNFYDIIVFHMTHDLYACKNSLDNFHGTIYLQSHSPKPFYKELIEDSNSWQKRLVYWIYRFKLEKIDRFSFERADRIIFPCEESIEPYYYKWEFLHNNIDSLKEKFRFLLTCCDPIDFNVPNYNLRTKLSIDNKAVLFCFVGRHIKTKGYDLLKKIGKKYKNRKDLFFIVLGDYSSRHVPKYNNWKELGFVGDVYSILKDVDFCLNLNELTYFDLALLEQLELGKNIIIRNTGGNKYISRLYGDNIYSFLTFKEFIEIVEKILNGKILKKNEYYLHKYYKRFFNIDTFIEGFQEMLLLDADKI